MKTTTNITYPAFALFAFACFALSPQALAVCQQNCGGFNNSNTFLGDDALINNTSFDNTAIGFQALLNNTTGSSNTAVGDSALSLNTGIWNTAIGAGALSSVGAGAGNENTATGISALAFNTSGSLNTVTGAFALGDNTTGSNNTAMGDSALGRNTTGINNIAVGFQAGINLTTGKNNIYIGNSGSSSGEAAKIRIGTDGIQKATFIAGISGVTVPAGVGVIVGSDGKLGTVVSSERFKDSVKPMNQASEAILALKPVTFRYKEELDPDGIPQFGRVAEQVEKVNPALVARDEQGKPFTVRYEAVNAMLLNEFLKEHRRVQDLEANALRQQKQIEALTAGLQKVSAQLELSKSATQTVLNDQ